MVVGVDITPPANDFGLDNLTFVTADIEDPWSFIGEQRERYDLISIRVLVSAIRDWPSLIQRCFDHLKPGAWIEIPDVTIGTFSDTFDWQDESSPLMRWYQCYRRGVSTYGIDGFANQKRTSCLATAQFTRISEEFFTCYLDEDAVTDIRHKEIARLTRQNMLGLLDAVTKAIQERGQWDMLKITSVELEQLKEDAKDDVVRKSASRRYYWSKRRYAVLSSWIRACWLSFLVLQLFKSTMLVKLRSLLPLPLCFERKNSNHRRKSVGKVGRQPQTIPRPGSRLVHMEGIAMVPVTVSKK